MQNKIAKKFQTSILNWYYSNRRHLPWRDSSEPFNILVAEVLLQKTDVEKVKSVYEKFMLCWPSPQTLSEARISSISKIIQPLGLRYKAERLRSIAKVIVEQFGGEIPKTEDELIKLPGIGRYIASAVECFANNKPKAILDTNIIRILDRVLGIHSEKDRPRDDARLWDITQALVPHKNAREYNWALLDFGALVCKSRDQQCGECVLKNMCMFWKRNGLNTEKVI